MVFKSLYKLLRCRLGLHFWRTEEDGFIRRCSECSDYQVKMPKRMGGWV